MPSPRLQHALVLTDDLDATKAFYCDVLGLEVGERPPLPFPGYWLHADGIACLHIAERAPYEAHAATIGLTAKASPVDHVAFEADGYEQLLERLGAAGVEVTTNAVQGSGVRQLFFDDPNGARIELVVSE
jgi:catechol 2,3-dioxygenase-like lactoylglutathione lyase family enzyme